ncbi:MAG: glycosyltransferase family 4 protein [Planctomycetota bacterium]
MTGRRIAHVFSTFGRGGPQARAARLLGLLGEEYGHLVLAMDGDLAAKDWIPASARVTFADPPPRRSSLGNVRALVRRLGEWRPDLVLTYNFGAIEAVAAARWMGLPLVHHEDGFGADEIPRRFRRRSLARRLLLRGVPVIVPSSGLLRIARAEWRLSNARHLPNGVDLDRFVPGGGEDPPLIGTVGGLRPVKDHATLLRAFARISREDCRLALVGDGPLRSALEALASDLGVRDRIRFEGAVADPAPRYRAFSVFALSSRSEQMPISLLEAMASGLPVASTDVGDVREVLPEECRSALCPPGDPDALARALEGLLADPCRRAREGRLNRARCEHRYGEAACLARFVEVYRTAMA